MVSSSLCGCATSAREKIYRTPYEATFESVEKTLAEGERLDRKISALEPGLGKLETSWVERASTRTQGLIFRSNYVERMRYLVTVKEVDAESTLVRVLAQVQERPPAGRRAYRWYSRAPDDSAIKKFLAWIDHDLLGGPVPDPPRPASAPPPESTGDGEAKPEDSRP